MGDIFDRMVKMELQEQKEKIHGCEGEHAEDWCNRDKVGQVMSI